MKENYRIEKTGPLAWMVRNEDAERIPGVDEACTVEKVQAALDAKLDGFKVTVAEVNPSGVFNGWPSPYMYGAAAGGAEVPPCLPTNMGREFVHVEVRHECPAGDERITVVIPTVWNGRYFACNGGSPYTDVQWEVCANPDFLKLFRQVSADAATKNGFAAAFTDGAIPAGADMVWDPTNPETGNLNEALMRNYDYLAKHTCNQVAKIVIEAITGEQPSYSYSMGPSGGGRINMRVAQRCPEDVDGIWAENPYFPYHETGSTILWAMVVMKDNNDYLPYDKFEAFREAVLERVGGLEAWFKIKERVDFDARQCIGTETPAGPITELDAKVMNLIWEGPKRADGTSIHIGQRPGARFWGKGWLMYTFDEDGTPVDIPSCGVADGTYAVWVARDRAWDWHQVTLDTFEEWYDSYYDAFARMDMLDDDADLRRLVKAGTKLIIASGTEDEYVPCDGVVNYYDELTRVTFGGDIEKTRENVRLFLMPGNDHMMSIAYEGYGPSTADGMIALMKWVEEDVAPESMPACHYDFMTSELDREGEEVTVW